MGLPLHLPLNTISSLFLLILNESKIVPDATDQDYIHGKYMGELVKGIILDETRNGLLDIVTKLKQTHGIQGLILGWSWGAIS